MDDYRDVDGKFLPGKVVPGGNAARRVGRPRKSDSMVILKAVTENAYTPDELTEMLKETYALAKRQGETKIMLQTLQLVLNYAIGKPVQRTLTASVDPDMLRAMLRQEVDDDSTEAEAHQSVEGGGGDAIEGEWTDLPVAGVPLDGDAQASPDDGGEE